MSIATIVNGAAEASSELRPFTISGVMTLLYRHASPHLSQADRWAIATGAPEHVEELARRAATLVDGIGCLVAQDGRPTKPPGAGNFQAAAEVSELLFLLGDLFRQIEGVSHVAGWAADELHDGGAS